MYGFESSNPHFIEGIRFMFCKDLVYCMGLIYCRGLIYQARLLKYIYNYLQVMGDLIHQIRTFLPIPEQTRKALLPGFFLYSAA